MVARLPLAKSYHDTLALRVGVRWMSGERKAAKGVERWMEEEKSNERPLEEKEAVHVNPSSNNLMFVFHVLDVL